MVHVPFMFISECLSSLQWYDFQENKIRTARVTILLKSGASHDMLHFSFSNKKSLAV
jgi:hypothetical protein